VEKPRGRWEDAVRVDDVDCSRYVKQKAATRNRESWRPKVGQGTAQKQQSCHTR
jgi:hypothetical protein